MSTEAIRNIRRNASSQLPTFCRRHFLQQAGVVSAGILLGSEGLAHPARADEDQPRGGIGQSKSFHGPVGLQLYSLRKLFKEKGPLAVLDQTQQWGFKYVEVSWLGDLTPAQYKVELDKRGLVPISKGFPYGDLKNKLDEVIAIAQGVGVQYFGFIRQERRLFRGYRGF